MYLRLGVFLLMIVSTKGKAQEVETFEANISSTLNNSNSVGFKNASITINLPLSLKKGILTNSLLFSNYNLDYNSDETIKTNTIENLKTFKYSLGYSHLINNKWSIKTRISPTISSNFESELTIDDFFINGSLIFNRLNKNNHIRIGIVYNTSFGTKKAIPILSYSRNLNNSVSYTLGMPITKIEYFINKTNSANLYLKPKGFYSNISDNLIFDVNKNGDKIKYQSMLSGFKYSHDVDEFWNLSFDIGYQFSSKYELLNNNKSVYKFKTNDSFFIGFNLKLDLL